MLDLAKIVDSVEIKVNEMQKGGKITFPPNYSPENALRAALLMMRGVEQIDECTPESISFSLLKMVVYGLNPLKKQCYPIAYFNKKSQKYMLDMQPSYHGELAMCKRIPTVGDVQFQVIREKDIFESEIINGKRIITKHVQDWQDESPIIGAYCVIFGKSGEVKRIEIINKKQIDKAWSKSKNRGAVHEDFAKDMVLRTVIRKASKYEINSSDDAYLYQQAITEIGKIEDDPIEEPAEIVDIEPEIIPDPEEKSAATEEKPEEVDKCDPTHEKVGKVLSKKPVEYDLFGEKK